MGNGTYGLDECEEDDSLDGGEFGEYAVSGEFCFGALVKL